jgi:hypothetical protein
MVGALGWPSGIVKQRVQPINLGNPLNWRIEYSVERLLH